MHIDLLAKGWDQSKSLQPPSYARLQVHLRAVQAAGEAVADNRGRSILENLGLDQDVWMPRLRLALSLAGVLHDLGKANSYFQGMVRGEKDCSPISQPIRHELVTVLMLLRNSGGVVDWLRRQLEARGQDEITEYLVNTVIGAVAGHHLKMDSEWTSVFRASSQGGGGTSLKLYLGHADLQSLFGNDKPSTDETWSLLRSDAGYPAKSKITFGVEDIDWQDRLSEAPHWLCFAAAVKALTVAADVAGSALLPEGIAVKAWIREALARHATAEELNEVAYKRLDGRPPRPFQRSIAASTAMVTLVEAGCGSGKTAAAYLWAANRAQGRKLFFCYPTTGTATEGFLDYVAESDVEAELIHSRAAVDLERVAMSREDTHETESEDEQLRIASLNAWAPQAVVCTVDTVLALVRNNRRGLYGSPAILSGCFVFDEIHAYDDWMFAALVALVRALPGAPILLMSATLPTHRKAFLRKHLGEIGTVTPPVELEEIRRYALERVERKDAFAQAGELVRRGKRVLWVCNVVARAQEVFDQARDAKIPTVAYHSRFRYQDRVDRHRDVVDGFNPRQGTGLLAVTTQVAEMSLDLDADLLITESAPVPALIQRLGRLNRRVTEQNHGVPRPALVVTPENAKPYDHKELDRADTWLEQLLTLDRPLSQRDLADQFRTLADAKPSHLELKTEWLDSGWCAMPGRIRSPGFTVNVILDEDADACRTDRKELIKRSLPMPYHARMEAWPRLRGTFIAPTDAIEYDEHRGGVWAD